MTHANKYNIIGAIFIVVGCFNTTLKDVADKILVMQDYSTLEIIWFRFALPFIIFTIFMPKQTWKSLKGTNKFLIIRASCFFVCSTVAVSTLKHLPIGIFTIIVQLSPVILIIGSYVFLQEKLTKLKWLSIIIGFIGVVVVLHPSGIDHLSLWYIAPFFIMIAIAGFNLVTKKIPKSYSALSILINIMFMLSIVPTIALIIHPSLWTTPTLHDLMYFLLIPFTTLVSQLCYIQAMKFGEASYVAPFFYSQMPFALIFGICVFHEHLNIYNIIGCIIILISAMLVTLSGLKTKHFFRKRRKKKLDKIRKNSHR